MRRIKAEAEETRRDLLHAALRLFDEKGYQAATLSEIAESTGVTRGALYWHFKNKADILTALAEIHLQPFQKQLDSIPADNVWPNLTAIYAALFAEIGDNPEFIRFARILNTQFLQITPDPAVHAVLDIYKNHWHERLLQLIHAALHNGELPADSDPEMIHAQLETAICGIMCCLTAANTPVNVRPYAARLITQTLDSIKNGSCRYVQPL